MHPTISCGPLLFLRRDFSAVFIRRTVSTFMDITYPILPEHTRLMVAWFHIRSGKPPCAEAARQLDQLHHLALYVCHVTPMNDSRHHCNTQIFFIILVTLMFRGIIMNPSQQQTPRVLAWIRNGQPRTARADRQIDSSPDRKVRNRPAAPAMRRG